MNAFTKTEYDWEAAYTFVVNKLEEGELTVDRTIRELSGMLTVSKYHNDKDYGSTSSNQLATVFFDKTNCLTYSKFTSLDPEEQEGLMVRLMKIKFAMALVYDYDKADKAFIDWKDGEHDT